MRKIYFYLFAIWPVLGILTPACTPSVSTPPLPLPTYNNGGIQLPEKFAAIVVVDSLGKGRARHLSVADNGDLYVNLRRITEDGYGAMALRDMDQDGRADLIQGFTDSRGTGMSLHGDYLYYASSTYIFRSPLIEGQLLPSSEVDTLVHIPYEGGHTSKTISLDDAGHLYVNVGSYSNACQEETRTKGSPGDDPCVELETRAGIWRFAADKLHQTPEDGMHYATGIRNAVAMEWSPSHNSLFAAQHGRDDLHRFWPAHYTAEENLELPSEEFLQVSESDDYGWPYCYYDHRKGEKMLAPEYGGDGKRTDRCEEIKAPLVAFPGHWGPNDLVFYEGDLFPERYKQGAFIAFHGSWNRLEGNQDGFCVVFIPMKDGQVTGKWEIFADGFEGPTPVTNPGKAMFRPTGLAVGADGALYISDSQKGRIWKVMYYQEGVPEVIAPVEEALAQEAQTEVVLSPRLAAGKDVYQTYCMACHQADGKGVPGMNPPLVATDWVTGDKTRLINVILKGLNEKIEIAGESYQNVMASHSFLTDEQIANVLSYIRNSFGNEASDISEEEVAALRAKQ